MQILPQAAAQTRGRAATDGFAQAVGAGQTGHDGRQEECHEGRVF